MTINRMLLFLATVLASASSFAMQSTREVVLVQNGTKQSPEFVATLVDSISKKVVYGTANYKYSFETGPCIERVYTYPGFRKQGHGTFLLNYILDHFKRLKFERVNVRARAFESHGHFKDPELLDHQIQMLPKLIKFYQGFGGVVLLKSKYEARMSLPTTRPNQNSINQV